MKKYLLATVTLICSSVFALPVHPTIELEGNYDCTGTELETHTVFQCDESMKQTGQTYAFTATCNDGASYVGTGIYEPQRRSISIAFHNTDKPEEIVLSVKHVEINGILLGKWTNLDQTSFGITHCTKRDNG